MPRMTISDAVVEIVSPKNSCPIILSPIKHNRPPRPYLNSQKVSVTLLSRKNSDRKPMMANMLEKKTMKVSVVTEKTAGMESTAKMMSENSITNSTRNSGVMKSLPSILVKKLCPSQLGVRRKCLAANFTTGWLAVSIFSSPLSRNILIPL